MKLFRLAALLAATVLLSACDRQPGILSDAAYRQRVEEDLSSRRDLLARCGALETLDDPSLTPRESEALRFLYAYMPLGDAVNFPGAYFRDNVRQCERVRAEMPWGERIPAMVYRHFVLPVRVNNEDLDRARFVFYDELRDRVRGLSMADAILEVNHWCHEKAVYTPTDSRTSAPLAMVRTAAGRCGEESTLLVTEIGRAHV